MSTLQLLTDEDLIVLNFEAKDRRQIIEELGQRVLAKGYINPEFITKLLEREEEFPTGLETAYPIAIPHVGEDCIQSFLAVATTREPIIFNAMDGSGKELGVQLIFLFGITNPKEQVEVLKKFMFAFNEEKNLKTLIEMEDKVKTLKLLKTLLGDGLAITTL
ncbi:MAG TPA: PTS sugar transporter subunit IIA [Anaerovoracaceae bacterium]|nr:PTS sugar transporter subunit IIA [Anaerovoracaceae bacterium]